MRRDRHVGSIVHKNLRASASGISYPTLNIESLARQQEQRSTWQIFLTNLYPIDAGSHRHANPLEQARVCIAWSD